MKVFESEEKKSKTKKLKFMKNKTRVSKSETTMKPKLLRKNIRVSNSERKSRVNKSCEEKSKSKNPRKLSEEELMERTMICGGTVVAYDRDDSSRCFLGEHLKSLVNLAIDFYNTNNCKDYRLVYLVRAIYESCQGSLYYMTMTAKLPNQDDSDAVTFEAEVYEGIPDTVVRYVRVLDCAPSLSPLAA